MNVFLTFRANGEFFFLIIKKLKKERKKEEGKKKCKPVISILNIYGK